MAGEPFQAVYRHRSGASHVVDGLRSAWEADVIRNALTIKEALDAGEDVRSLKLRVGSGRPRPALAAKAQRSQAFASLPFIDLVQQLQCCADRARQEAVMRGPLHGGAFTLLHAAAACHHKEAALLLLAAAPGMAEQRDRLGRTALFAVAELGWADVVRPLMLAAFGAATVRDDSGATPLVAAHARGQLEAACALLSTTLGSRSVRMVMGGMLRTAFDLLEEREMAALLWVAAATGSKRGSASLLDDVLSDIGPVLLRTAIDYFDARAAQVLLEAAPWLATQRDSEERTALHWLAASWLRCSFRHHDAGAACQLAEALLAVPGTATAVDSQGRTALFTAASYRGFRVSGFLKTLAAAAPATVAQPAATGETPVHLAILADQTVLQALLDAAPEQVAATVTAGTGPQTPLQLAVQERHWQAVAGLLDAVMQASRSDGQDSSVSAWQLLLEAAHGPAALAELVGDHGRTLLHAAAELPTAALLQLLLSEQVGNVMAANYVRGLPLHAAAEHGCTEAVRLLLAAAPAAAMVPDGICGMLPLHYAAASGNAEAVRLLLAAAPQAAAAGDGSGSLPLHRAAQAGSPEAVRLLLEAAPAAASSVTRYGQTALMLALICCHKDAASLLMGHGSKQEALSRIAARYQHRCAYVVIVCLPLSATEWAVVPSSCPELGSALPPALQHSAEQARQLVRRLPAADAERLRLAALALAREQRRLRAQLPGALVGRILSLVLS